MKAFATLKFLSIFLILLSSNAFGAEFFCHRDQAHPIDTWYTQAMDKTGGVNPLMRQAQGEAYQKWDHELNQTYQKLLSYLSEKDKKILRESQKSWLKFMDTEIKFAWLKSVYGDRNQMASLEVWSIKIDKLRDRVCDLETYLNTVEQNKGL